MAHERESPGTIRMELISSTGRSNHSEMMDKCLVLLTFGKKDPYKSLCFKRSETAWPVLFSNSLFLEIERKFIHV